MVFLASGNGVNNCQLNITLNPERGYNAVLFFSFPGRARLALR
jgi:hypothetical protein